MVEVLSIIYIVIMMFLLFGITIFVHEFGHYIVARWCGLVVETFSIGMGPALWKKEIGGIVYKIGAFPIGGYVSLPQLDPEGMEKMQGENENDRTKLPEVSPWNKIAVSVAGPLCNVIFAFLLAWIVFMGSDNPILEDASATVGTVSTNSAAYVEGVRPGDQIISVNDTAIETWSSFLMEGLLQAKQGKINVTLESTEGETKTFETEITNPEETGVLIEGVNQAVPCLLGLVSKNTPAEKAGLEPNDIVVEFNGENVIDWFQFVDLVQATEGKQVGMKVQRDDKIIETELAPEYNDELERYMIGVGLGEFRMKPMDQIKSDSTMMFRTLKGLVTPSETKQVQKHLGGPVKIFEYLFKTLAMGLLPGLAFIRFINMNLAVLNLLPIPVLDGGHIVFSLFEGITKRKIPAKIIAVLVNIFAVLLITLMIVLTWRDAGGNKLVKYLKDGKKTAPVEEVDVADSTNTNTVPIVD